MPTPQSFRQVRLCEWQDSLSLIDRTHASDVQLALRVSKGLRPKSASALAKLLGTNRVIGPVIPEATLRRARRSGKALSREHSERLYEVGRVVDAVSRVYHGDRTAIETFSEPGAIHYSKVGHHLISRDPVRPAPTPC